MLLALRDPISLYLSSMTPCHSMTSKVISWILIAYQALLPWYLSLNGKLSLMTSSMKWGQVMVAVLLGVRVDEGDGRG